MTVGELKVCLAEWDENCLVVACTQTRDLWGAFGDVFTTVEIAPMAARPELRVSTDREDNVTAQVMVWKPVLLGAAGGYRVLLIHGK